MKNKKIIAAGHISLDITPGFPDSRIRSLQDIFRPGKLVNVEEATVSTGGSVSNTGLALKKLGADVVLIGKIADDAFGAIMEQLLSAYQAEGNMIRAHGEHTSYTIAVAPPGVDRMFLHHMGCNSTFCYEDLDFDLIARAGHFHFGYPPLMRRFYLDNARETVRVFQKVKELGLTTSLDMAAVEEGSEAGSQDWEEAVRSVIPYVDFFVPSVEELASMIGRDAYHTWQKRAKGGDITSVLDIERDVKPLADKLLAWGAKCVLIKCGAPGLFLKTASADAMKGIDPQFESWGGIEHFEPGYVPDRVLSATGAGDTSIAAFLKSAIDGYPARRCLQLAAATGASCVTAYDALSGLKSFDELNARIEAGWAKN